MVNENNPRNLICAAPLADFSNLSVHARCSEPSIFAGRPCLRVEDGLVVINEPALMALDSARIEVDIAAETACYPGIAFRIGDTENYELVYTQPHSSCEWDALQYDPVFNGSATWQIYHGPGFQKKADIPTGEWYTLFVEFSGSSARAGLVGQEPLYIESLATPGVTGGIGIWTYLPAHFANLRVYEALDSGPLTPREPGLPIPPPSPGLIAEWLVDGFGPVACEPHGILNLNRYFPLSRREVTLVRQFRLSDEATVAMSFGLSDDLTLSVDGLPLYTTTKAYRPTAGRLGRGYIEIGTCRMTRRLPPGTHELSIKLKVTEPFGWGLIFSLTGSGLGLLPISV